MMLHDLSTDHLTLIRQRNNETNSSAGLMNSSVDLDLGSESFSQADSANRSIQAIDSINHSNNNSTSSSSSGGDGSGDHVTNLEHAHQASNLSQNSSQSSYNSAAHHIHDHSSQQQIYHQSPLYFNHNHTPQVTSYNETKFAPNTNGHIAPITTPTSSSGSGSSGSASTPSVNLKTESQTINNSDHDHTMNADGGGIQHHSLTVPAAHCSDQSNSGMHYPLTNTTKDLPSSGSSSNMALNFSHDLLLQTGTNNHQASLPHHHSATPTTTNSDGCDIKPKLSNSFEFDSGLIQSATVGANMWKNTIGLNHFKHPAIGDHSFLQSSEMNSFSNWTHGTHQTTPSLTHPILDGHHLIGYPQHHNHDHQHHHHNQRQIPNQDLVEASLKNQACVEQASLVLNSINHQASALSHNPNSNHHHATHQSNDNLHLRSHPLDPCATSYNLTINDTNQFYNNNSRAEIRSHQGTLKQSMILSDRSVQMSLGNHHHASQLSYLNSDHANHQQPTTSHHHLPGSSSGLSKNIGNFRCPHCNEVFTMRNLYQSHLKTHSQEKGSKAKFQCELCFHSFSQKTSLNRHMKSHTGERPFPCEICGKAFSEKERLKIHMRTHTGEKPFSCSVCGKSFSQKSTVKRHQTVHTGEKKFKCDCGKGFANRGNLIAHIKTRGANHFE